MTLLLRLFVTRSILALILLSHLAVHRQSALHHLGVGVPVPQPELLDLLHRFPPVQQQRPGLPHPPKGTRRRCEVWSVLPTPATVLE